MSKAQEVVRYPSLRSLKTIRGVRHELTRLYLELKLGLIEPQIAGRLAHMLSILISSTREQELEARIAEVERALDTVRRPPPLIDGRGIVREIRPS